jgi:hypothetical protein
MIMDSSALKERSVFQMVIDIIQNSIIWKYLTALFTSAILILRVYNWSKSITGLFSYTIALKARPVSAPNEIWGLKNE